jgi:2-amino-4-hydroxy-6-hydroxymethyldihydropteridine diphosphokinase
MTDLLPAAADRDGWEYAIGLGSNLGDRFTTLRDALEMLVAGGAGPGDRMVAMVATASPIETAPVGGPPGQGPFLNTVTVVRTGLGPHQLLARLQRVETLLGRCRTLVNGPRIIDLDLLARADGLVVSSQVLQLPHPRLASRAFALVPLAEIAPDWHLPGLGSARDLAAPFLASASLAALGR